MNVSNTTSVMNSAQEAMETAAQTRAEAAKGDQQAVRKLASNSVAKATNGAATSAPVDSDGDHDGSKLNVRA